MKKLSWYVSLITLILYFQQGFAHSLSNSPKTCPCCYYEEEVIYENGVKLVGTLSLPNSKGPFPAVIIIHGSGPLDRDGSMYGHKFYLVLADHLTKQGIAVLRFDKRGIGKSNGDYTTATSEDLADDVLAGVEYLKRRKEINSTQIGLVGHSEGGYIAPMVATKSKDVSFIVMMAGPAVNGEKIWLEQGVLLQRVDNVPEELIALDRKFRELIIEIMKKETNLEIANKRLQESIDKCLSDLPQDQKKWVETKSILAGPKYYNTKWFQYFLSNEPTNALVQITIPVLALSGELDFVVSPKQNLPVIRDALETAGNRDYTILEFPKINHAFQTCQTGSGSEYEQIEETMAPIVLNKISNWILNLF